MRFACLNRALPSVRMAIAAMCLSLPTLAWAQVAPPVHPDFADEKKELVLPVVQPQTPEFKAATDKLREHLKLMRTAIVRYNISESPVEQRTWQQNWYDLLPGAHQLHTDMVTAALAEFKADPDGRRGLADMLFNILEHNFEDDRLDGMVELTQALIEAKYPSDKLPLFISMSAYATADFDVAKPYLTQLAAEQTISPQLASMLADIEQAKLEWEEEMATREADSQGEALPRVRIKTTKGDIEIELFENQAPDTVANFISLVEQGFYNNLTFHRVLEHFVAQGGCPIGDGTGEAGYRIYSEANKPNARKLFRGYLAMDLRENLNSASSQFFITLVPTPQLNENFTAFGRVINGMEVLSNLNRIDPENKDKNAPPVMPDEIREIEIIYKRDHEYKPNKVASP